MPELPETEKAVGPTIYWHDYETFGLDRKLDRPAQFAGIRTDMNFNRLGEPDIWYCKPSQDYLPEPTACLVTGITPQLTEAKGCCEHDFAEKIRAVMIEPETLSVGYNSMRFDDEVTRNLFWRNLYDAYEREWANGCSRWDLFPFVLAVWALRPEGIEWPLTGGVDPARADLVTFRLEKLTQANGISHTHAHDAASDVEATIDLAKLIAGKQPKLWQWALANRSKKSVVAALESGKPCVWVDPRAGQKRGYIRVVLPITIAPVNKNEYLVWDCREDPRVLVGMPPEEIRRRAFGTREELNGEERLSLASLKVNQSPFVCNDLRVLTDAVCARFGIDKARCLENMQHLAEIQKELVSPVYSSRMPEEKPEEAAQPDLDAALYGGLISTNDRTLMIRAQSYSPADLTQAVAEGRLSFEDPRLTEMLWRMRLRNWPETLTPEEKKARRAFCAQRLSGEIPGVRGFEDYFNEIDRQAEINDTLVAEGTIDEAKYEARQAVLDALYAWGEALGEYCEGGDETEDTPQ